MKIIISCSLNHVYQRPPSSLSLHSDTLTTHTGTPLSVCCGAKCKTVTALPPVRQTPQSDQSCILSTASEVEKQIFLWEQSFGLRAAAHTHFYQGLVSVTTRCSTDSRSNATMNELRKNKWPIFINMWRKETADWVKLDPAWKLKTVSNSCPNAANFTSTSRAQGTWYIVWSTQKPKSKNNNLLLLHMRHDRLVCRSIIKTFYCHTV